MFLCANILAAKNFCNIMSGHVLTWNFLCLQRLLEEFHKNPSSGFKENSCCKSKDIHSNPHDVLVAVLQHAKRYGGCQA